MIVIIVNSSKKKAFRRSKRIVAQVLQPISNRISIGEIPKRVFIELAKNLKSSVTKGTSLQVFFESKNIGFRGFKCFQIGICKLHLDDFTNSKSLVDKDLIFNKIIMKD